MSDIFDTSYNEDVKIEISDNRVSKGDNVNITAKDPTMTKIVMGVGWDLNAFDTDALDLDVSCFLLDKDGKTIIDEDFIFYNNTESRGGAIIHNGDSRSGAGEGDDESIDVDLNLIPFEIIKVMFVLSIYNGDAKEQTMGGVKNSYIRLLNSSNGNELLRYELSEEVKGSKSTGMLVASVNREGPKWHFEALGEFVDGGLSTIATNYGMIVQGGN